MQKVAKSLTECAYNGGSNTHECLKAVCQAVSILGSVGDAESGPVSLTGENFCAGGSVEQIGASAAEIQSAIDGVNIPALVVSIETKESICLVKDFIPGSN